MMDIPTLAFLLTGIGMYLNAIENHSRLWPASIFMILAAGTGYTALVPVGCLLMWAIGTKRQLREWLAIAVVPMAVFLWLLLMKLHFGEFPSDELVRYYTSHFSFREVSIPMFSFLGAVGLFPWVYLTWVERPQRVVIGILSISAAGLLSVLWTWPSMSYRLWFVVLASSGIGLLILFATRARRPIHGQKPLGLGFLLLWLPATLLFFLFFAEMMSARYLLLVLPPLFLVVCEGISGRIAIVATAATLVLSCALAVADYRLVNSYPHWIAQNIVPLEEQGFGVWNAGESGLRFYLEKTGAPTLEESDVRPRGAELVIKQGSFRYSLSKEVAPLLVHVCRTNILDAYPIRTLSRDAGAGFHDSRFGVVPFIFSTAPLDYLEIDEMSPFVETLPETIPADFSSVPVWFPGGVLLKQVEPMMKFKIRTPKNTKADYEIDGSGYVGLSRDGIVMTKTTPEVTVWKNFKIVPAGVPSICEQR
jgi:hypothetical protein